MQCFILGMVLRSSKMREIKFRAYYHGGGDPRFSDYWEHSEPFPYIFWKNINDFELSVEINQYTGFKDKNGKDIYEGDIINLPCHYKRIFEVKFGYYCNNGLYCEDYLDGVGFYLKHKDGEIASGYDIDLNGNESCEIIGNIYENKELLK